jgi:hypothetical protein
LVLTSTLPAVFIAATITVIAMHGLIFKRCIGQLAGNH